MDNWLTEQSRIKQQLLVLNEATKILTQSLALPEILNQIIELIIREIEPAGAGCVMLWDQSSGSFRAATASGYDREEVKHHVPQVGESITSMVYQSLQPVLLDRQKIVEMMEKPQPGNRSTLERSLGSDAHPVSSLAVPVMQR